MGGSKERRSKGSRDSKNYKNKNLKPLCIDCGGTTRQTTGAEVYPSRPDLRDKPIYVCVCGARVQCHPGSTNPLGYACGPDTSRARQRAHAVFDPIWRAKGTKNARSTGYKWLAAELGIRPEDCHIGMMDRAMAQRVYDLCKPIFDRMQAIREDQRRADITG